MYNSNFQAIPGNAFPTQQYMTGQNGFYQRMGYGPNFAVYPVVGGMQTFFMPANQYFWYQVPRGQYSVQNQQFQYYPVQMQQQQQQIVHYQSQQYVPPPQPHFAINPVQQQQLLEQTYSEDQYENSVQNQARQYLIDKQNKDDIKYVRYRDLDMEHQLRARVINKKNKSGQYAFIPGSKVNLSGSIEPFYIPLTLDYYLVYQSKKKRKIQQFFVCNVGNCMYFRKQISRFFDHYRACHTQEKKYVCPSLDYYCQDHRFWTEAVLKQHIRNRHKSQTQCRYCNRLYQNDGDFWDHVQIHQKRFAKTRRYGPMQAQFKTLVLKERLHGKTNQFLFDKLVKKCNYHYDVFRKSNKDQEESKHEVKQREEYKD